MPASAALFFCTISPGAASATCGALVGLRAAHHHLHGYHSSF
ncbi:hypothetical protein [Hymenobacter canadensis]|uniref:Uncharacterized protein n=1 Tax=Hymenobacter canadensis TaxID=2999067 RepID=A0ABY7LU80_9BACT|nr:hypothetical protein [Hymenobacter canadensis]WBA43051.1 hypothetical protein O3303_05660 [Hymenobacter canadensis]